MIGMTQRIPSISPAAVEEHCSVRTELREATADTHERMHQLESFRLLEQGRLDRNAYAELLVGLSCFHSHIADEARRYALSTLSSGSNKVQLLHRDLAALGRTLSEKLTTLNLPSAEHALGALYVAQGSMFGGKILASQLDYLFGTERVGRTFFLGTSEDAPQWRALVRELETHAGDRAAVNRMISGADLAFRRFERCVMCPAGESTCTTRGERRIDRPAL